MSNTPPMISFYDLCMHYKLDDEALWALSGLSGVPRTTISVMIVGGILVERADAEKVLAALSHLTGITWNLENVIVPRVEVCYG